MYDHHDWGGELRSLSAAPLFSSPLDPLKDKAIYFLIVIRSYIKLEDETFNVFKTELRFELQYVQTESNRFD